MFKLQRYFSITSAIAIVVLTIVMSLLDYRSAIGTLIKLVETRNDELAQSFANSIRPRFMSYVREVSDLNLDGDTLRGRPETEQIHATLQNLTKDLPVLKVKIYGLNGLTVYSSEFAQIGEIKEIAGGFGATLNNGMLSSALSQRDRFTAFSGIVYDRSLTETYVPIFSADGSKMQWIFELYADVTPLVGEIRSATTRMVAYMLFGLGLLYAVLFLIVRHADQILKRQYQDLAR